MNTRNHDGKYSSHDQSEQINNLTLPRPTSQNKVRCLKTPASKQIKQLYGLRFSLVVELEPAVEAVPESKMEEQPYHQE